MSFDISWIASENIPLSELEERMGLRRTGRTSQEAEFDYASVTLKTGWNLGITGRVSYLEQLDMPLVSRKGKIVTLALHDGIMISVAESWTDGVWSWRVFHDGQKHIEHLVSTGDLPSQFAIALAKCEESIRSHVPAASAHNLPEMPAAERALIERMGMKVAPFAVTTQKVDFHFSVPIDLAESLVGFRHNRPPRGLCYYELASDPAKKMKR